MRNCPSRPPPHRLTLEAISEAVAFYDDGTTSLRSVLLVFLIGRPLGATLCKRAHCITMAMITSTTPSAENDGTSTTSSTGSVLDDHHDDNDL